MRMKPACLLITAVAVVATVVGAATSSGKTIPGLSDPIAPPPGTRPVDLVICLDTSGSMTQLIDSARAKLWDIVTELARAKPTPHLRIGLLTYGTPGNSTAEGGWIVKQTDLTDDLDTVYAKMMAMNTSGGDEFVGWVLNEALNSMSWSKDEKALKIIFVAGNESADQARERYDFRYVADYARANHIYVNSIYAGSREQGVSENWHEVAIHGGGNFSAIDMAHGTIQIPTPQDDILYKLNIELNATYVPYGSRGRVARENQAAQDSNAASMGAQACADRVAAKGSALYSNAFWDLVDAIQQKDFDLAQVETEELPEDMQSMSMDERKAHIEGMLEARHAIQKRIAEVNDERQEFLKKERAKNDGKVGLDDAILKALREQAKSMGFEFEGGK